MGHTTEWTPINHDVADLRRKILVHGREVEVAVSPYDIPEAVRVSFDDVRHRLKIEFRYISADEDRMLHMLPTDIILSLGKMSSRLYSVDFSLPQRVEDMPARFIEISNQVGAFATNRTNSKMVDSAIRSHASDVDLAF